MRTSCWSLGVALVALMVGSTAFGQSVRSLVNDGNSQYKDQKYGDAEVNYRKALEKDQGLVPGHLNLGSALYKQDKTDEAIKEYENALMKAETKEAKSQAYYNMGNAFMKGQRYEDAVKSYIESLKLAPDDQDTKYNLSYALEKMKQQQQQQQNKNDKNKDDKKDQQKKDQQKQDQQKEEQQKQDQQKQQQQNQQAQQQKPQQGQEKKMAKADAERILDVLKNNEKDVQKKLRVRPAVRSRTEKDW